MTVLTVFVKKEQKDSFNSFVKKEQKQGSGALRGDSPDTTRHISRENITVLTPRENITVLTVFVRK